MNWNKVISKISLLALVFCCIYGCKKKEENQIPLSSVTRGTFYIDLYEEGEIEAINSISLNSPILSWRYGNLKISQLVKDGAEVQAGDTLIVFDPTDVQKAIIEAEARLELSIAELNKMRAQHESDLEEMRADQEVTRISQQISQIRFESAVYESEIKKKEIQLNLEKSQIALDRAQEQIDNRIKIQKEEIKQKNLSIQQDRNQLADSYETLQKLFVTTPSPGIAIINSNWSTGNKFQVGEQCYSGFPIIQLPDLSSLKANVKINEVDIAKIEKGIKVEIRPDAFSDQVFTGSVSSIANLAANKEGSNKIKVFPVEIIINETDKNLLPGLTVSCRLLLDKIDDVLFIPLDAVHLEGGIYYVYKKTSGGYDKVEVEVGARNTDHVIITSGLDEKDKVALVNPVVEEENTTENTTKPE